MRTAIALAAAVLALSACGNPCTTVGGGGAFCLPDSGVAASGQPLSLQIHSTACSSTCLVSVDAGTVSLSTTAQVCPQTPGPGTGIPCFTIATCSVPALTAGDWTVVSDGVDAGTLHVASGGETRCELGEQL